MKHITWAIVMIGLLLLAPLSPRGAGGVAATTAGWRGYAGVAATTAGRGYHAGCGGMEAREFTLGVAWVVGWWDPAGGTRPTPTIPRRPWWSSRRPRSTSSRRPRPRSRPTGTTAEREAYYPYVRECPADGCKWCRNQPIWPLDVGSPENRPWGERRPPLAAVSVAADVVGHCARSRRVTGATILRGGSCGVAVGRASADAHGLRVRVLVGTGAAIGAEAAQALPALAALVVAVAIQVGTNYHNDASDYLHGVDTKERRGRRATAAGCSGLPGPGGAYVCFVSRLLPDSTWCCFTAGSSCWLGCFRSPRVSPTPRPHSAWAIADWVTSSSSSSSGSCGRGTDYVQTGAIRTAAVLASVPVGLLATAVLVVNNLRDLDTDRAAGKRTLAVRLGPA